MKLTLTAKQTFLRNNNISTRTLQRQIKAGKVLKVGNKYIKMDTAIGYWYKQIKDGFIEDVHIYWDKETLKIEIDGGLIE